MSIFLNTVLGNSLVKDLPGNRRHTNIVRMLSAEEKNLLYKHYKGYNYVAVEHPDIILLHTRGSFTNKFIHVNDLKILEHARNNP